MCLLTSKGIDQKTRLAVRFLNRKVRECKALRQEIREVEREVDKRCGAAALFCPSSIQWLWMSGRGKVDSLVRF